MLTTVNDMAIKTSIHEGEKDEMWQTGLFQCEIYITGVNKLKVKNYKKKKKKDINAV